VLALYLAALILGLGMFAIQVFASADADHHDGPLLGSGGHAGATPGDVATPGHGGSHGDAGGHAGAGAASIFISLRFYMFAAIGFGAVGAPVTALGASSPGLTLAVALGTGLGIGVLAALGFRALGRGSLNSGTAPAELLGQVGRVLVACEKGRVGKVRLTVRGQIVDVAATTDELRLEPGSGIIVEEVHAARVHVCAAPSELLPE
jgi:membrane protein implicated in regulation of membrane protease activity